MLFPWTDSRREYTAAVAPIEGVGFVNELVADVPLWLKEGELRVEQVTEACFG